MNLINRMMSYDKAKIENQEQCNCEECVSAENADLKNQIAEYPKLSEEEIEQIISERYSDKDEKTKKFIKKALRKHGDRYNYSKVLYVKATKKIEIICRIEGHKPFLITPNNHLNNHGCPSCGGNKKLTNSMFIERANKVHGEGTYDYSKVNYVNNSAKVVIICHNHETPYEFKQQPNNHLQGQGCPLCKGGVNITTREFIKRANEAHGEGTYDYSKVNYINMYTDVIIICKNHKKPYEFWQTPSSHLKGCGCSLCAKNQKLTTEEFIEKANKVHGEGIYDYSQVNYVNNHTEVTIICSKHGEFKQIPNNHLNGSGCPSCGIEKCADNRSFTLEEFIEKANEKQGIGTYDYSKVKYINSQTKVTIICPKHGDFKQTPSHHLQGQGCPKCNNYKGEVEIRNFLTENEIEFEEQKRFDDCRNILPLPFDFYIPKYNLCIEYDGIQHFQNTNWYGKLTEKEMIENFQGYQFRDNIKNEYCKKNRINLLRLNNLNTIYEELIEYFQKL